METKDVFDRYKKIEVFYQTSDTVKFFSENAAKNHAKTLENKTIEKVYRNGGMQLQKKAKNKTELATSKDLKKQTKANNSLKE